MCRSISAMLFAYALMLTGCGHKAGGVDIWAAVKQGDVADIGKFAAAGGNLDVKNSKGSTPLWVALDERNKESYEALLKHGADPNIIMRGKRVVTH